MRTIVTLCLTLSQIFAIAATADADQQVVMEIKGMTCEICAIAIKKALTGVQGVKRVKVSYDEKKAWVDVDKSVTDKMLGNAVQKAGEYEGTVIERN